MGDIIGHKKIQDFFAKVIDNGAISHAYCFVGQQGVGKQAVVNWLAKKLLTTDNPLSHPDFIQVVQMFDEKKEKTKKDISIDQIRELRGFLARRSFSGGFKVAVIEEADKMNEESANALLKTLEEPSKQTVLFLLTTDERQLPATIQSRCQMIYFYPVKTEVIQKSLESLGVGEAEEMALLARGLPGLAMSWVEDREKFAKYSLEVNRFVNLLNQNFHNKIKAVEDLFGDKSDHIKARGYLQEVLEIWQIIIRDSVYCNLNIEKFCVHKINSPFSSRQVVVLYNLIEDVKQMLKQNIHPRLLVENILLELP